MFQLKENGTTVKRELFAGLTTFLTMAYVIIVNPIILSAAGVPIDQVFMATIIAAVIGTGWMALCANYPIAVAPGMGLNAYFTYTVVLTSNGEISYMTAFAAVFVAGLIFIIISLTPFREKLIIAIPENLKLAITAGIGLFIAFIGFVYLLTINSSRFVRFVIPFLVVIIILSFGLSRIMAEIIFSSALICIRLLICLPNSFHLVSTIS